MTGIVKLFYRGGLFGIVVALSVPAAAALGDVHAVTGETVNLRSGPREDASIRSTVRRGDEVIELRRDGNWLGVRVLRTGEEGWLFSDLVRERTASTLGGGAQTVTEGGFSRISPDFDRLIASLDEQLGYRFAEKVDQTGNGGLRVVPTQEWIYNTSREAKMYAALALYGMWKNYNNGRPVNVALGEPGPAAITIEDGSNGPTLGLPLIGSSR